MPTIDRDISDRDTGTRDRIIRKDPGRSTVLPNLPADPADWSDLGWDAAQRMVDGLPGGGLNIAHECLDRHLAAGRGDHVAIRWWGRDGERRDLTYADLTEQSARFAGVLEGLEVGAGEKVFLLTGRRPELYVSVLGALRHRSVVCTLFAAFGPEPIRQRLALGDGRVLVTTPTLYRRKVAGFRDELPGLRHVILLPERPGDTTPELPDTVSFDALMAAATPAPTIGPTDREDPALLHFTSGTTGKPKGALHVHQAVLTHIASARWALDLHDDDVFWCTADPGWVTGTSYGIIAPLAIGVTSVVDEADFEAQRWLDILAQERVTVWYTAPTAVRMMMRADAAPPDLPALRFIASVGEPLNPEAVFWGLDTFGLPIHDNWWQTETGGIMVANTAAADIRPGSMGRPLPGVEVGILRRDDDGEVIVHDGVAEEVTEPDVEGELALRPGWPSMFRGYLDEPERTARCFVGGWYRSGDLARRDVDGWIWFVGRADDVIKTSGHMVGPFEVESVLVEHPAVSEAGVIGVPDPIAGQVVKAFVSLNPGHTWTPELRQELIAHARKRLGAAVAPKDIEMRTDLPITKSGKILRRLLRARELGLPEGDLSTLEERHA
jgi:acetyl-CoA synthetase